MDDLRPDVYGPALAEASILVVDDEPGMRNFLIKILPVSYTHLTLPTTPYV